jgi:type II restriction/modification system DNA methylase subunit YeeA
MNKANLKSYAPKARLDFIKAVTERANVLGISATGVVPVEVRGDVALIDGREWPAKVAGQRDELIARIKRHGFEQTMDEVAYTWFNRFAALRYMEIHDYLGHGWRVLSSRDGGLPEILRHASEVTLPGLNADRAREMQLAGNQDNELYKLLLVAQCNELSRVMPFLFERIDDETELLLPENLLRTDSIVAKLVEQVPEEDWQEIEVIGWLYQFYISEKKDQVIGKAVKSEDIPAATQLFTPNWIVQYLMQNSVGRLWLMANPTSTLASQWPYYIQPAEQTPEVRAQLDALLQTRIREDGETLNPETITVLDPACGSGHILAVAYDVLKAIYLERGYQHRSIPRLILEKNLYGLDIDDRAAQLAAFALLMKARHDDRRLFNDPPKLNVLSLRESKGLDVDEIAEHLTPFGLKRALLNALLETFTHAKTFGSLIRVPSAVSGQLTGIETVLEHALQDGDLYARQAARDMLPIVLQALMLATRFDAVVANPPYMGNGGMNDLTKGLVAKHYPDVKGDLFACFMIRGFGLARDAGFNSMVTMQSWMFLSSYQQLREVLTKEKAILTLAHIGFNSFPMLNSKVALAVAFSSMNVELKGYKGVYIDLNSAPQSADKGTLFLARSEATTFVVTSEDFSKVPGTPISYAATEQLRDAFRKFPLLDTLASPRKGMVTADNARFIRIWQEISFDRIGFAIPSSAAAAASGKKWFPYAKGGPFRRWAGNYEFVVNWENEGYELLHMKETGYKTGSTNHNLDFIFRPALTWTMICIDSAFRVAPLGFLFDNASGLCHVNNPKHTEVILAVLNSPVVGRALQVLNPTLNLNPGNLCTIPVALDCADKIQANECVKLSLRDWDSFERSWDFVCPPILSVQYRAKGTLAASYKCWQMECMDYASELQQLEGKNNSMLVAAYGLGASIDPAVPIADVSLTTNPAYRYGPNLSDEVLMQRSRTDAMTELVSFAVGCMMGRYSLDEPGLIYAHSGNVGFDSRRYEKKFPADADGILPVTDERWFEDDAASRVKEFLRCEWSVDTLTENMTWLAEGLGATGTETPDETIRRYLTDKFFKDHLQTYKKRPIYWLFSSGKQGAFQALVYLHRYNTGTLARMRAEYVVPLIAKMASRLDMLDKDVAAASSAAARTKVQKQIESLRKKQIELLAYGEKLRHHADMRITLDLDDGVKVNYAKFGDLVAESKAITGGREED